MTKSDSLKHQLSESLQAPRMEPSKSPVAVFASQKRSITLYQADLDILDRIRDHLREAGIRNVSDSEAVRIACRTVSFDATLEKAYASLQRDDRRRRS